MLCKISHRLKTKVTILRAFSGEKWLSFSAAHEIFIRPINATTKSDKTRKQRRTVLKKELNKDSFISGSLRVTWNRNFKERGEKT